MKETPKDILPSLSFVAELANSSQTIYDVLEMLCKFALLYTRTISFSKEEATSSINDFYGFSLPQAVVTSILRMLNEKGIYKKTKGKYSFIGEGYSNGEHQCCPAKDQ